MLVFKKLRTVLDGCFVTMMMVFVTTMVNDDITIQYNTIHNNTIHNKTIHYNTIKYNTQQYNTI